MMHATTRQHLHEHEHEPLCSHHQRTGKRLPVRWRCHVRCRTGCPSVVPCPDCTCSLSHAHASLSMLSSDSTDCAETPCLPKHGVVDGGGDLYTD